MKGSNPRVLRIREKLLAMLNNLPKDNIEIFGGTELYIIIEQANV